MFRPGPIFTNVLMADELNRASARSQSALLEAMEERQVTADGTTMPLPRPFMVLATQNPFDAAGTSPLPHGQRDRFLLRLSMGYPSREHEDRLLARADTSSLVDALGPALSRIDLDALLRGVGEVHVSEALRGYILDIITASRSHPALAVGASPRGAHCTAPGILRSGAGRRPALRRSRRRPASGRAGARPSARPPSGQRALRDRRPRGRHRPRPSDPPSRTRDTGRRPNQELRPWPARPRRAAALHSLNTTPAARAAVTRLRPTLRGVSVAVVALILLAVAVGTGDPALLLVLVAVALPLAIAPVVVLGRARRAAGVEIHLMVAPPLVPVGTRCDLLVQLSPADGAELPPLSLDRPSDHWSAGAPDARPPTGLPRRRLILATDIGRLIRWDPIASGTSTSSTVGLPTKRRGVFTIGPLRLWVHDPFALFGLTVASARPVTLVVHPPPVTSMAPPAVRPGWSGAAQFGDGPASVHTDDPGGEWNGLRPYEPGDRLHLLSWQAEARFGALLVHDFRPDSEDVVTIVFDDRAGVHRRPAFEKALGAVFGLASGAGGRSTDYDVSTLSGRRVRGSTTPDGFVALLTFLAETQPTRSSNRAAASSSSPLSGALVITTATAAPTLVSSADHDSVLVVE